MSDLVVWHNGDIDAPAARLEEECAGLRVNSVNGFVGLIGTGERPSLRHDSSTNDPSDEIADSRKRYSTKAEGRKDHHERRK